MKTGKLLSFSADGMMWSFIIASFFYTSLIYLSGDHVFFWDTVQLASRQAHHFYEGSMFNFLLPDAIDSGHMPFFGWLLALHWKVFGKSLLVSHWMMWPWVMLLVYYVYRLSASWATAGSSMLMAIIVLLDPTLMAQCSLVSPDVLLMVGFLMAVCGLMHGKKGEVVAGTILCVMISNRGAMVAAALAVWQLWLLRQHSGYGRYDYVIKLVNFIPAGLIFAGFQSWHYFEKSWIGYHDFSPWAASFEIVNLQQMIVNVLLIFWRFADFGRIAILILLGASFYKLSKNKISMDDAKPLVMLIPILAVFLLPSMILHSGLTGHRYLLPLILMLSILCCRWVTMAFQKHIRNLLMFIAAVSLIAGHLWLYPRGVAMGWDASLAHWPYFNQWEAMQKELQNRKMSQSDVASAFPNTAPLKYLKLSNSAEACELKDIGQNEYFVYSRIFNDISDKEYEKLQQQYEAVFSLRNSGLDMVLYRMK